MRRVIVVHVDERKGFPHGRHFLLTLTTCGLWFPVWTFLWLWSLKS